MNRRFIVLDENNVVSQIRLGAKIVKGEIESQEGELFQILEDGKFRYLTETELKDLYGIE